MSKTQITDSVKRIASKLSRKGVKGVTEQIRAYIAEFNDYQGTTEQENLIFNKFFPITDLATMEEPLANEPNIEFETAMEETTSNNSVGEITSDEVFGQNSLEPIETEEALEPTDSTHPESLITVAQTSSLEMTQQTEALQVAIQSAPSEIKQSLMLDYAEREFNTIADILAFKNQVDSEIDSYFQYELQKQNEARSKQWQDIERHVTENASKEVAKRQQTLKSAFDNLRTKIREYSS